MIRLDWYKDDNFQSNAVWNKETFQAYCYSMLARNMRWENGISYSTLRTSLWSKWVVNKRALRWWLDVVCKKWHWSCKYDGVLGWRIGSCRFKFGPSCSSTSFLWPGHYTGCPFCFWPSNNPDEWLVQTGRCFSQNVTHDSWAAKFRGMERTLAWDSASLEWQGSSTRATTWIEPLVWTMPQISLEICDACGEFAFEPVGQTSVALESVWCTNTGIPTARLDKQTGGIHAISSIGRVAEPCARSGIVDAVEWWFCKVLFH